MAAADACHSEAERQQKLEDLSAEVTGQMIRSSLHRAKGRAESIVCHVSRHLKDLDKRLAIVEKDRRARFKEVRRLLPGISNVKLLRRDHQHLEEMRKQQQMFRSFMHGGVEVLRDCAVKKNIQDVRKLLEAYNTIKGRLDSVDAKWDYWKRFKGCPPSLFDVPEVVFYKFIGPSLGVVPMIGSLGRAHPIFHVMTRDPTMHPEATIASERFLFPKAKAIAAWTPTFAAVTKATITTPHTHSLSILVEGLFATQIEYLWADTGRVGSAKETVPFFPKDKGVSKKEEAAPHKRNEKPVPFPKLKVVHVGGLWVWVAYRRNWQLTALEKLSMRDTLMTVSVPTWRRGKNKLKFRKGRIQYTPEEVRAAERHTTWWVRNSGFVDIKLISNQNQLWAQRKFPGWSLADATTIVDFFDPDRYGKSPKLYSIGGVVFRGSHESRGELYNSWLHEGAQPRIVKLQATLRIDKLTSMHVRELHTFRTNVLATDAVEDYSGSELALSVRRMVHFNNEEFDTVAPTVRVLASYATKAIFPTSLLGSEQPPMPTEFFDLIRSLRFSRASVLCLEHSPTREAPFPEPPESLMTRMFPAVKVLNLADPGPFDVGKDAVHKAVRTLTPQLREIVFSVRKAQPEGEDGAGRRLARLAHLAVPSFLADAPVHGGRLFHASGCVGKKEGSLFVVHRTGQPDQQQQQRGMQQEGEEAGSTIVDSVCRMTLQCSGFDVFGVQELAVDVLGAIQAHPRLDTILLEHTTKPLPIEIGAQQLDGTMHFFDAFSDCSDDDNALSESDTQATDKREAAHREALLAALESRVGGGGGEGEGQGREVSFVFSCRRDVPEGLCVVRCPFAIDDGFLVRLRTQGVSGEERIKDARVTFFDDLRYGEDARPAKRCRVDEDVDMATEEQRPSITQANIQETLDRIRLIRRQRAKNGGIIDAAGLARCLWTYLRQADEAARYKGPGLDL
ncbi:unnamed protein product [Vitrella brassicaformis CCMP3155]|uniref:Uncharacterized protein n=2 Tax=Vitrella brassicaformis TaxID=1169539 RepID=A0A0G4FJK3_VITBC|nr:unnamed protein product [Vitrella brassicaformis CCMP3155]|eukprot:CEM13927.1 unnamed protein product [Vitrella brassicaformis CCMP3155]